MAEELRSLVRKTEMERYAKLLSFVAEGIVPTPYLRELEVAKDAGLVELKDTGKFSYEWRLTEKGERIRKRLNSDKNSWRKFQTTLFDFE